MTPNLGACTFAFKGHRRIGATLIQSYHVRPRISGEAGGPLVLAPKRQPTISTALMESTSDEGAPHQSPT